MNTLKIERRNTLMIAHRGVSGLERENSAAAFVAAGNRSYFGIETDVHVTSDGKFIVIHDDNTKRVTGIDAIVENTDFDTLRAMKLTDMDGVSLRNDLCLPSLEEYVDICKKYDKLCVLELKNEMEKEHVWGIVDVIAARGYLNKTIFISFAFKNLVYVREKEPEQQVQFLFKDFSSEILEQVKEHGFDVDVYYRTLTKENITLFHEMGIKVNCWTVDHVEDAERLVSWGVDFITSNILE